MWPSRLKITVLFDNESLRMSDAIRGDVMNNQRGKRDLGFYISYFP